jgi:hypothetical protein
MIIIKMVMMMIIMMMMTTSTTMTMIRVLTTITPSLLSLQIVIADTSKREDMARVVEAAMGVPGLPLIGVIHCAGISNDILLKDLKDGDYDKLAACKAGGALYLHELTKDIKTVRTS